jgi:GNAT superfamily N-acetyltransferase
MSEPGLQVRLARYDDPVVRRLEEQVQAEYVERYGGGDRTPVVVAEFDPPAGVFLVGWVGEEAVVCGGFRAHGADAEVKRMYVPAGHRGHGYARTVLAELESRARAAGYGRIILETGTAQPEAIALYTSSGYQPIPGFGHYRDSPHNRCFGKDLAGS